MGSKAIVGIYSVMIVGAILSGMTMYKGKLLIGEPTMEQFAHTTQQERKKILAAAHHQAWQRHQTASAKLAESNGTR